MEIKDRVEALEGEFKLIKGELKETLASVRDYLTDLKLPPADDPALMAGIVEEESPVIKGEVVLSSGSIPQQPQMQPPQAWQPQAQHPQMQAPQAPQPQAQQPQMQTSQAQQVQSQQPQAQQPQMRPSEAAEEPAELPEGLEMDEVDMAGLEMFEPPQDQRFLPENVSWEAAGQEPGPSTPQVNLLANLIRWVSNAKKGIGSEQLPVFLEVYGISGHLSPELKETILHLAEIAEPPMNENAADVWSQLTLELHGILTGSDGPLHPVKPSWREETAEVALDELETTGLAAEPPAEEAPFKLKLVLPGGDGKGKEYSISLNPEMEIESSARRQPPKQKPRNER